jgi:hypothetical protein
MIAEVIQADRDAAADVVSLWLDPRSVDLIRCGGWDDHRSVQGFAAHRIKHGGAL